jgi:heme-degrading monooxygenase HmoA
LLDLGRLLVRPQWRLGDERSGEVRLGKFAADNAEQVVVLLLGVRINRWRRPGHWLPVLLAMPAALRELRSRPESGLLGYRLLLGPGPREAMLLQYWRSKGDVHAFAHHPASSHRTAQRRLWRHYAAAGGAVGVWHEMLPLAAGGYHGLYGNMPPTGVGAMGARGPLAWELDADATACPPG